MWEFIAILFGVPVAFLVREIDNQRLRYGGLIALSLVVGFGVAELAGELAESIGFGFFDALQCAAGAAVTLYVLARYQVRKLR
jgi:hypothetical protein